MIVYILKCPACGEVLECVEKANLSCNAYEQVDVDERPVDCDYPCISDARKIIYRCTECDHGEKSIDSFKVWVSK